MYKEYRLSLLNGGNHPHLDPDLGIFLGTILEYCEYIWQKMIGSLNNYYRCIFGQESFHYVLEVNRIRTSEPDGTLPGKDLRSPCVLVWD